MPDSVDLLEAAKVDLQNVFPVVEVGRSETTLVLQIGTSTDAVMVILVSRTDKTTYDVLFPKAVASQTSEYRLEAAHMNRATVDNLRAIANQLYRHGAVLDADNLGQQTAPADAGTGPAES